MLKFLFSIIKLIIAILVIPTVFAVSKAFLEELSTIDPDVGKFFFLGAVTYLAIHLFAFKPLGLYQKGQRFLEIIFGFSKIFAKFVSHVLPLFTVVLFVIYLVAGLFWDVDLYSELFLILAGFFTALHFLLAAEDLKTRSEDLLKANYLSSLLFIWIFCLIIASAILHFAKTGFYFDEFIKNAYSVSSEVYLKIWDKILLKFS